MVRATHRNAGRLADGERFVDRCDQFVAFVAYVRHVTRRARLAGRNRARGQLGKVGVASGFVDQTARCAQGTVIHRFPHETRLRVEFFAFQAPFARTADARARRAQPYERGDVARDAAPFYGTEKLVERRPIDVETIRPRIADLTNARFAV